LPILFSSGMSDPDELDGAVALCCAAGAPFAVFQCTTAYPCPPESIGLNVLAEFRERYACPVGLSDHSGKVFAGLAAAALGASLIEVHVAFSRQMFGPDVPASLTFPELAELVHGIREIGHMLRSPVSKAAVANQVAPLRRMFGKSVVAARDLPAGTVLQAGHLALKKPGTGIPAAQIDAVIGRRLSRHLSADALLAETDLE
jgi:N-acetylneuraminate synthase